MFIKPIHIAAAVMLLAACDAQQTAKPAPEPQPTPAPAPIPAGDATAALTADGWGPIRMGMSHAQAITALKDKVQYDRAKADENWVGCHMIQPSLEDGVWIMVEQDKVTRVSLEKTADIATDKGVKVGDDEQKVRDAYPAGLTQTPHKYRAAPAKYLTWYATPGKAGMRYSIGEDGKVHSIAGGTPSIEYVEGCA